MWWLLPAREEGEEAGGKKLKIHWEFFVFKNVLSLCITELGERKGKKKACLLYRLEKSIPYFCTSLS